MFSLPSDVMPTTSLRRRREPWTRRRHNPARWTHRRAWPARHRRGRRALFPQPRSDVAGLAEWSASHLRALGWEQALRRAGAEVVQPLSGDWTARSGYLAGLELAEDPSVTAIFASNDETALGIMYALTERGLRSPEDISVVGYDGALGADYFRPALTTVRVDGYEHGRTAVAHLIAQLDGLSPDPTLIVPHELVIRRSTAKAPRRRRARPTASRHS